MKVAFTPLVAILAAGLLSSGHADAQVRVGGGVRIGTPRARVSVVVGRPYAYRPYIYRPYYYGSLYDPFYFNAFYGPYYRPFYWYPYGQVGYGYGGFSGGAALRLQVTPRETEVYIDNYYAGTVDDFDGMFQRLRIEPGAHDITLYHDGYRVVRQRIYLQPTGTFRLRYMMVPLGPGEPAEPRPVEPPPPPPQGAPGPPSQAGPNVYPPPPPRGSYPPPPPPPGNRPDAASLSIRVQPANAEVLIDGERWDGSAGDERLVVQVAPGLHHIEVRRDGYRSYQSDVNARPGETSTVNISLTRQP
ncbi:MAG TPA: PEGA domain-containing protein [Vicinamibacterales bacterium]|nr:PEGA domain-containing protein [Vicinamibacterales bacterium]